MASSDVLTARIRAEFREMPGLNLSLRQACRLWQVAPVECERVLKVLLDEGFLGRTLAGNFVALPTLRSSRTPVKVTSLTLTSQPRQRRTA